MPIALIVVFYEPATSFVIILGAVSLGLGFAFMFWLIGMMFDIVVVTLKWFATEISVALALQPRRRIGGPF